LHVYLSTALHNSQVRANCFTGLRILYAATTRYCRQARSFSSAYLPLGATGGGGGRRLSHSSVVDESTKDLLEHSDSGQELTSIATVVPAVTSGATSTTTAQNRGHKYSGSPPS